MSSKPPFAAHTPPEDPPTRWQTMREHILGDSNGTPGVANLARQFAQPFGAEDLAYIAGLLHDVGKYSTGDPNCVGQDFQDYLRRCWKAKKAGYKGRVKPGGGDHKGAGALLSRRLFSEGKANCLALAILGHHGEMPARRDAATIALSPAEEARLQESIRLAQTDMPELCQLPESRAIPDKHRQGELDQEMFVRMLYSCLVDADSLDTEAHFYPKQAAQRRRAGSLEEWQRRLNAYLSNLEARADRRRLSKKEKRVHEVRRQVRRHCLTAAENEPGFYRLTVPTGGGKTLASLSFALAHALDPSHSFDRIVYAIPYTSIIDQTAQVFRAVWKDRDAPLLVHHSALPDETGSGENENANGDGGSAWRRLASENWDADLIVTTTVQLFESLASNKPGRCRKLHNLARSIIILDEAQMTPLFLLQPILDMLKTLRRCYGVTVVFCTATQPAFNEMSKSKRLRGFKDVKEIVPEEGEDGQIRHFQVMTRVDYRFVLEKEWSWQDVATAMSEEGVHQCLAIVNTRKDALKLLTALNDPEAFHLSTLLCGAHREAVLKQVSALLKAGKPCRLVATQVVECGCDLDFRDRVLRAIGPFDRLIQAAGRCNREGKKEKGEVIIFLPEQGGMPPDDYKIATETALDILKEGELNLNHPEVCQEYFRKVYAAIDTDARGVGLFRKEQNFPAVARTFHMIAQDTLPVLVRYEPQTTLYEKFEKAARAGKMNRALWREAQPLLVNLYRSDIDAQKRAGNLSDAVPGSSDAVPGSDGALYIWKGEYDSTTHRGMVDVLNDPADPVYSAAQLIIG